MRGARGFTSLSSFGSSFVGVSAFLRVRVGLFFVSFDSVFSSAALVDAVLRVRGFGAPFFVSSSFFSSVGGTCFFSVLVFFVVGFSSFTTTVASLVSDFRSFVVCSSLDSLFCFLALATKSMRDRMIRTMPMANDQIPIFFALFISHSCWFYPLP